MAPVESLDTNSASLGGEVGLSHVDELAAVMTMREFGASRSRFPMITYQKKQVWRRTRVWALVIGAVVGAGGWWWVSHPDQPSQTQTESVQASSSWTGVTAGAKLAESALVTTPPVMEDGRPADFTPEDWAALKEAMAKTPNPNAETERVVKYLRFQRGFEQWNSMKDSPDVAHRQELAKRLLEQVPERMRNGETTMGEALMLTTALWTDLEPTEAVRKQRIEEFKAILVNSSPKADPEQLARDASQLAEYKRREAAIVADWQAKPAAQRDQAKLEESLESARRAVYASDQH